MMIAGDGVRRGARGGGGHAARRRPEDAWEREVMKGR
jgi:hypothetical protein